MPAPPIPDDYIDPKALISRLTIEQLCATAEGYFSRLSNWDDQLAKPFGQIQEVPQLLSQFAILLEGLQLVPGLTVLDFGAGSGWTTQAFTQMGCRAIALDASRTALDIAQERYRRRPVIGERPAPQFLHFDGRHIDLPDGSVDRIFCFDAFHHVPNEEAVLREMYRVLREGGICAFAEPGPFHSRSGESQFEMRNFGVLENDVDVDAIWKMARTAGFSDIRLALVPNRPKIVTKSVFDSMSAGRGRATTLNSSVRNFFLYKGTPSESRDSRTAEGLGASIAVQPRTSHEFAVHVTNTGTVAWYSRGGEQGSVSLGIHLRAASGEPLDFEFVRYPICDATARVDPGNTVELSIAIPSLPAGDYLLEFDLVSENIAWFHQIGATEPQIVPIAVPAEDQQHPR